jgi:hypothetical protein
MICPNCAREIVPQTVCPLCQWTIPTPSGSPPPGDAFQPAKRQSFLSRLKTPVLVVCTLLTWALLLGINYLRAIHYAGAMNAHAAVYMISGILTELLLAWLVIFLVDKARHKDTSAAAKVFRIAYVAVFFSMLSFTGSIRDSGTDATADAKRQMGNLLKEAAGKQPQTANTHWWDGPSRDFFHDIMVMNQQYSAEMAQLDQSALTNLYSPGSYSSKKGMEKIVAQLQASLAVDEKYASLDPFLKSVENRVRSADAPDSEKEEFLKGLKESTSRNLAPRNETFRTEKNWLEASVDLYEFTAAHSSEYSVRAGKLYFRNAAAQEGFTSRQSKAISLRAEFLKAQHLAEVAQKNALGELGVSPSDFTPASPDKSK